MQNSEQRSKKRVLPHNVIIYRLSESHTAVPLCGPLSEPIHDHVYEQIILVDIVVDILFLINGNQKQRVRCGLPVRY